MTKKEVKRIEQLKSYFPFYTTDALESFIQSNIHSMDLHHNVIAELERENTVIREEIARRQSRALLPTPTCEIDLSAITSYLTSTQTGEYFLQDTSGEYSICLPEYHPCHDLIRVMSDEWEILDTAEPGRYIMRKICIMKQKDVQ